MNIRNALGNCFEIFSLYIVFFLQKINRDAQIYSDSYEEAF